MLNDATDRGDRECELYKITGISGYYKFDVLNGDTTEAKDRQVLNNLKKGEAASPEGILKDLKIAVDNSIHYLIEIYHTIFKSGSYPSEWAKAANQPIHKKGNTTKSDIYGGVSPLNCVRKRYTSVINSPAHLTQWAADNDVMFETQKGFREDYSTVDHIFVLHAIVSKHLKKNKKLYVAFVDFRKAFDTVKGNFLWNVLVKLGICGNSFNIRRTVFSPVQSCVAQEILATSIECKH